MIFLADDYICKYQEALTAVIYVGCKMNFSPFYIERSISYSKTFSEFEKSNVTLIAFSSIDETIKDIYHNDQRLCSNDYDIYDEYGWLGYIYIKLFFSLNTTFENLFVVLPIEDALAKYHIYHEMDFSQIEDYVKTKFEYSYLNMHMKKQKISTSELAKASGVNESTIRAIRYGKRDPNKLDLINAMKLSEALHIKTESIANDISLVFQK